MTSEAPLLPCYVSTDRPIFSPAECDTIIDLGERRPAAEGLVQSRETGKGDILEPSPNRDSHVSFFERDGDTEWIYQRLQATAQTCNRRFWHFGIEGLEMAQFARYGQKQHYDWHMDLGSQGPAMYRKLSLTVQLSDPDRYAGGDLEFKLARSSEFASRERGSVTIFPSYILHRVNPVTQGERCSLVQWVLSKTPFR